MERLTSRDEKGNLNVDGKEVYAGYLYNAVALLEEYEDTGLTPGADHGAERSSSETRKYIRR